MYAAAKTGRTTGRALLVFQRRLCSNWHESKYTFFCLFLRFFKRKLFIRKWGSKTPKTLKIVSATFLLVCFLGLNESIFQTKRNKHQCISITVCQLGGVNPTYERYILGPTPLNRHMSLVPKKWCCLFFIFLLCVYFADQNPSGLEFSGNT